MNWRLQTLTYFFISSASLTFLFIIIEYNFSQHEQDLNTEAEAYYRKKVQPRDLSIYPRPWTLIDIKMQYLINNLVCHPNKNTINDARLNPATKDNARSKEDNNIFMIILITSHAGDIKTRDRIRKILPKTDLDRLQMRRIFLLAKADNSLSVKSKNSKYHSVTLNQIAEENEMFGDVLVGDFLESYHNLTYKHLMGLEWVTRYCPKAKFVLKQDDDIIVDFYQLSKLLRQPEFFLPLTKQRRIFGKILHKQSVVRDTTSKWFVPTNEYSNDTFPDFVSGWAYITTGKVVKDLVTAAMNFNYFWIDDVHITGTLRESAKVDLVDMDKYFTIYKGQIQCCISTSAYSKSTLNQPYWCDYVVGPPNDDLDLMEIFHNHSRFCHTTKTCLRREGNELLNYTCVVTDKMVVNNYHKTKVSKPIGLWKPIKL